MSDEKQYSIGELAEAAETTPRTIRYYTTEGVLPPPDTQGRYAIYNEEHLQRLCLIRRLKEGYLPLHEIKARIAPLSRAEVQALLQEPAPTPPPPPTESAAGYLAGVMGTPLLRMAEITELYSLAEPGSAPVPTPAAMVAAKHTPVIAPQPVSVVATPSAPAPSQAEPNPTVLGRALRRLKLGNPAADVAPPALDSGPPLPETWQRIVLVAGVELHLRQPLPADLRQQVERLLAHVKEVFG